MTGPLAALVVLLGFTAFAVGVPFLIVRLSDRRERTRAREMVAATQRDPELRAAAQRGWNGARSLLGHLAAGRSLEPLTVWGVVLNPNEQAFLTYQAAYSPYYSTDASYVHVNGLFMGSLPFMAVGSALTAMGNASRRDAAIATAALRWREQQNTQLLLTTERIICNANGRWMSFYFSGVRAFYPEPQNWSVVFEFNDCEPLRLAGESGPAIAAYVTWMLHGPRGLREHPGLEPLR